MEKMCKRAIQSRLIRGWRDSEFTVTMRHLCAHRTLTDNCVPHLTVWKTCTDVVLEVFEQHTQSVPNAHEERKGMNEARQVTEIADFTANLTFFCDLADIFQIVPVC